MQVNSVQHGAGCCVTDIMWALNTIQESLNTVGKRYIVHTMTSHSSSIPTTILIKNVGVGK